MSLFEDPALTEKPSTGLGAHILEPVGLCKKTKKCKLCFKVSNVKKANLSFAL